MGVEKWLRNRMWHPALTCQPWVQPLLLLRYQNVDRERRWKSERRLEQNLDPKAGGHTSTVAWTTPRSPYVMHGGYSVIQVELLHEWIRRARSVYGGTIPEQNGIDVPDL